MNAHYDLRADVQARVQVAAASPRRYRHNDSNSYFAEKNVAIAYRLGSATCSVGMLQDALKPWSRVLSRGPENCSFAMRVLLLCSLILCGLGIWLFPQGMRR